MTSFSPNQQKFIATYSKMTGLHPGVVSAQVAAEEPVGAHSGYHGTQDWLNIGITDSGPMGAGNPAWRDPVAAAKLSANWVAGRTSIPGFGRASSGIRSILSTAGQSPQAQISALQRSGWASSGYPSLGSLYASYGRNNPSVSGIGGGGGSAASAASGVDGARWGTTQVQAFDKAGYQQAQRRFIAGSYLSKATNPFQIGPKANLGPNPLFTSGLLTTKAPNRNDYISAQTKLQRLAGGQPLTAHPQLQQLKMSNIAGGFLPAGAKYIVGRKDQGRDGQTNPGGAIVANGNGHVVNVLSNPGGFGPRYPLIHFTSGPFAGRTLYFGHTLSAVKPGQSVRPGQVISHTGTTGIGNATVPGWFEIGYADGGSPGPFGQRVPF
jgi:hypothetical protein